MYLHIHSILSLFVGGRRHWRILRQVCPQSTRVHDRRSHDSEGSSRGFIFTYTEKSTSIITPTLKKPRRKSKDKVKHQVFSPGVSAVKIAQSIRDKWFVTEGRRLISKAEIGIQLYLLSLAPDGQSCVFRKRFVQQVVGHLVMPPQVASYKTIRRWISVSRCNEAKPDTVPLPSVSIRPTRGKPPLATKEELMQYLDSTLVTQHAGDADSLKDFLTAQLHKHQRLRGLEVSIYLYIYNLINNVCTETIKF